MEEDPSRVYLATDDGAGAEEESSFGPGDVRLAGVHASQEDVRGVARLILFFTERTVSSHPGHCSYCVVRSKLMLHGRFGGLDDLEEESIARHPRDRHETPNQRDEIPTSADWLAPVHSLVRRSRFPLD